MKTEQKMVLAAAIACGAVFLTFVLNGCSGDDSHCMATEGCTGTDAGPMTADADPTAAPDADRTPDAAMDPCAEYTQYNGQVWTCGGSFTITECTLQIFEDHGICYVYCIEACPVPPAEDLAAGIFTCTTVSNAQQQCWQ